MAAPSVRPQASNVTSAYTNSQLNDAFKVTNPLFTE